MDDTTIGWRFTNKKFSSHVLSVLIWRDGRKCSQNNEDKRQCQDEFAMASQKNILPHGKEYWKDEIAGIEFWRKGGKKSSLVQMSIRRKTSMEKLAALKPAFDRKER
jgi:acetyl-CoA C-acetyltransferase